VIYTGDRIPLYNTMNDRKPKATSVLKFERKGSSLPTASNWRIRISFS
jgi:hypothetical protein